LAQKLELTTRRTGDNAKATDGSPARFGSLEPQSGPGISIEGTAATDWCVKELRYRRIPRTADLIRDGLSVEVPSENPLEDEDFATTDVGQSGENRPRDVKRVIGAECPGPARESQLHRSIDHVGPGRAVGNSETGNRRPKLLDDLGAAGIEKREAMDYTAPGPGRFENGRSTGLGGQDTDRCSEMIIGDLAGPTEFVPGGLDAAHDGSPFFGGEDGWSLAADVVSITDGCFVWA
jgi:hypothetical protein